MTDSSGHEAANSGIPDRGTGAHRPVTAPAPRSRPADVRLGDVNDPPADRLWGTVLLLCGNLGLGGSWEGSRRLLARLAELVTPGAVLVGDSVTPEGSPQVALRIRYRGLVTPWWPQYNIPAGQMAALVDGTGWQVERHLEDGEDHAVLLRRA